MDYRIHWIWLSLACTVDTVTFPKLIAEFNNAKDIYEADDYTISKCIGGKMSDRSNLADKSLERAEEIFGFCQKYGVGILTYADPEYPENLRKIPTPPVVLYYRGKLPDFNRQFCVAAVGTRNLSDYGRKNTFKICYDLAIGGATIVSGMALGIDGVAHAGAIAAEKPTVAVLGCGIDVCYPPQHLTLAREIVKSGCIITEYPPKTPPSKFNFPKRNRIISGLCSATVIFEGRENSGALITARYAKEQGRAVYALPGNVGAPNSEISNLLLKDGARLCTRAEDVFSDFEKEYTGVINPFMLKDRCPIDILYALRQLEVVANCPTDDIYIPVRQRKKAEKVVGKDKVDIDKSFASDKFTGTEEKHGSEEFDKEALRLYKKIPLKGYCDIESLLDEGQDLRQLMKLLLKLEIGKFIVLLPGDRVARKSR